MLYCPAGARGANRDKGDNNDEKNYHSYNKCCTCARGLASCGSGSSSSKNDSKVNIVCTIFPEYDWARQLTKGVEDVEITYLLDSGADLHSYQPTAEDMLIISDCDLFIYAGGESDSWV